MKIDPRAIRLDGGTQPRESINQSVIDEYAEAMAAGVPFPAPTVFYDGTDYWLADGFHRVHAAIKAGIKKITPEVMMGDVRDAILFAAGANASHGLRRSRPDMRRAVMTLLDDEEWGQWSNEQIAKRCRVDPQTVANYRPHSRNSGVTERKTVNKHGQATTIKTDNIGKGSGPEPVVQSGDLANIPTLEAVEDHPAETAGTGPVPVPRDPLEKPEFAGEEPEPVAGPMPDAEWLDTLPCRAKLPERTREIFDRDALIWRAVFEGSLLDDLRKVRARFDREHKHDPGQKPETLFKLGNFLDTHHPRSWLMCGNCDGVGCDGRDGTHGCHRRGYVLRGG